MFFWETQGVEQAITLLGIVRDIEGRHVLLFLSCIEEERKREETVS